MAYETTIEHVEDVEKAIDLAQQVLMEKGYRLSKPDAHTLHAKIPGMVQNSKDPLRFASEIKLDYLNKRLRIRAELGGIRHLVIMMVCIIGGLGIVFLISGVTLMSDMFEDNPGLGKLLPLAPLAPWPVMIPLMAAMFRQKALTALDTFVENLATVAGGTVSQTGAGGAKTAPQPWGMAYILVGVGLLIATGVVGWTSLDSAFPSMRKGEMLATVPGEHLLFLDGPETYTIFHQHRTEFKGKRYNVSHELEGLQLSLVPNGGGDEVAIDSIEPYSNYSNLRLAGYSAFRFTVDTPGPYDLTATYPEGQEKEESVLSIVAFSMPDVGESILRLNIIIILPTAGVFLIVIGIYQRRRGR